MQSAKGMADSNLKSSQYSNVLLQLFVDNFRNVSANYTNLFWYKFAGEVMKNIQAQEIKQCCSPCDFQGKGKM